MARDSDFADPRLVSARPIDVSDARLAERLGAARFFSATYRLFKINDLESACEDYGQAVIYRGTIPNCAHQFVLDNHHAIETGKVFPVCGNTWRMLHETRFKEHFEFIGDFRRHYGLFPCCGGELPFAETQTAGGSACC